MAVIRVFAKADVGRDIKSRKKGTEKVDGLDNRSIRVIRRCSAIVLSVCLGDDLCKNTLITFAQFMGTPKRITLWRPFLTRGPKKPSSLFKPHRR